MRKLELKAGKIVAEGTPYELKKQFTGDYITIYNADEEQLKALGKEYRSDGKHSPDRLWHDT